MHGVLWPCVGECPNVKIVIFTSFPASFACLFLRRFCSPLPRLFIYSPNTGFPLSLFFQFAFSSTPCSMLAAKAAFNQRAESEYHDFKLTPFAYRWGGP